MPNTFKLKTKDGSSTNANTNMDVYTVPGSCTTVVIGCTLANLTAGSITADAQIITASGDDVFIGKNLPIPTGSSLDIVAGKICLETGDVFRIQSDTANSLDTALSIMEQS